MLGDGAELLLDRYGGDLRRLYGDAEGVEELETRLQEFPRLMAACVRAALDKW